MATILQFPSTKPEGRICPRCEGTGVEAHVYNQIIRETVCVPCGKCDASGWFTALAEAEGEVRYWRSRWESVQRVPRARKERQTCAENLEFWTNKTAFYANAARKN